MEKDCEHTWESMGGVAKERFSFSDSGGQPYDEPKRSGSTVIFAVFCPKCGEIKEKAL